MIIFLNYCIFNSYGGITSETFIITRQTKKILKKSNNYNFLSLRIKKFKINSHLFFL